MTTIPLILAADTPHIAALTDGYLIVWYDTRDSSKVWSQKVGFGGNLIGENFPIQPDSTGGVIAVEAQNHPDGRVLVSWVTNGAYSRGRWLDDAGTFLGDVFNMADTLNSIGNSLVRFAEDGTGILYQYAGNFIYTANLDSIGEQVGSRVNHGNWHYSSGGAICLGLIHFLICNIREVIIFWISPVTIIISLGDKVIHGIAITACILLP